VAWLGMLMAKKFNLQKVLLGGLVIFLGFFAILTIDRNRDWRDPITFYNQTLKYAPDSYRVINNLGMAYAAQGSYKKAEETYKKAIALDSSNPIAYHNLGNAYKETGKKDLAIKNFETAISLDPSFVFSYNALVNIYLEEKNYQKTKQVLEAYLDHSSSKVETLFLLAKVAAEEGNLNESLGYLKRALEIDPQNQFVQSSIAYLENLIKSEK
jgi:tetratricopeptide (TPR) repeat protein